ncbi:MAG: hypothetical protein K2M06_03795 [Muribaculaceae bacterium]|nr:hypothetical protein [Muribaculaceae bacterium]
MKRNYIIWAGLCLAVFAVFFVQGFFIEPEGDDLGYGAYFNYYGGSLLYYPRWVLRHWALTNGRFPNYLLPLLLWFSPRWLALLLNAAVVALFFYFSGKCLGSRGPLARTMLAALLLLTMAWWDASTLMAVSLNYVWAAAAGLAFAYFWLVAPWRKRGLGARLLFCLFAFVAGQMHEAMAAPLSTGLLAYCLVGRRWRGMERWRLASLLCFFAGTAVCLASPALWMRVGGGHEPDDALGVLLLKSDFYVLALVCILGVSAVACRSKFAALVRGPWLAFAVAAVASMCISGFGGIVGRSGWFAQTYALIVLLWLYWPERESRVLKGATYTLTAAAVVCWGMMTGVQVRLSSEARMAAALFRESPTGTFYMDHTPVGDLPWYALGRPRGAVSNCEDNTRRVLEGEYRPGCEYAMLPARFEEMSVDSLLAQPEFSREPRAEYVLDETPYLGFLRDSSGRPFVEVRAVHKGAVLYYSEPVEAAPGYRVPKW